MLEIKINEPWVKTPINDESTGIKASIMKLNVPGWFINYEEDLNNLILLSGCINFKEFGLTKNKFPLSKKRSKYLFKSQIYIIDIESGGCHSVENIKNFIKNIMCYPLDYIEVLYLLRTYHININKNILYAFENGLYIFKPMPCLRNDSLYKRYGLNIKVYKRILKIQKNKSGDNLIRYEEFEQKEKLLAPFSILVKPRS